jgi:TetR/AcrR family transcriptional regulator, regulator of cefoperazone and chloramphenicol sensitivity
MPEGLVYSKKKKRAKERIVESAILIMTEEGIQAVTIRKIAERAKVNIAAINYYFGMKENILKQVFGFLLEEINRIFSMLDDTSKPACMRLTEFLKQYTCNLLRYQNIFKSLFNQLANGNSNISPILVKTLQKNLQKLKRVLSEALGHYKEPDITFTLVQMISGVLFPLISQRNAFNFGGIDYSDEKIRNKYIESLTETILSGRKL